MKKSTNFNLGLARISSADELKSKKDIKSSKIELKGFASKRPSPEFIEKQGFKKVNNSCWRLGDITMQNCHTHEGKTPIERLFNTQQALRVCVKGKFVKIVKTESELLEFIKTYKG